jgi:pimeloyl-ACP methyl ester carboxylesterase
MTGVARAADGAGIAWSESGRGDALLLISGQSVDHTAWDAIVPTLAQRFRVITFDHRGTGRSDPGLDGSYTTRVFAQDAIAVLDDVGADRTHVYGHSMGGRIAQWLAIDYPTRVASLVLAATTAGDARGVRRSSEAAADLASGDPDRLARQFFRDGQRHPGAGAFFDRTTSRHVKRLHFQASRDHDTWDLLSRIAAPTLVIHGTSDQIAAPSNAERIATLIPDAELHLLPDARHGLHIDTPAATEIVIDFLGRHPIAARN